MKPPKSINFPRKENNDKGRKGFSTTKGEDDFFIARTNLVHGRKTLNKDELFFSSANQTLKCFECRPPKFNRSLRMLVISCEAEILTK